jgi:tight adherence protein C
LIAVSPIILIAIGSLCLSLPLLVAAAPYRTARRVRRRVRENLARADRPGMLVDTPEEPRSASADDGPVLARRISPLSWVQRLEQLHAYAGRPAEWPVDRLLAGKYLLATVAAALSVLYVTSTRNPIGVLVGLGVTALAFFLPELLLKSRGQERNAQIGLELADTLDQMTIAVEAGLGFDSAMGRAARNGKGPLAEELVRTLQDIQVGQTRRQAYESLAKRTDVPDLRRFIRAVIQADAYGIAIADVLRTQAGEMRLKRRMRAEEKAMQIPVKVVMPLMFCILPVLFIVLLGPAAMDIVAAFS